MSNAPVDSNKVRAAFIAFLADPDGRKLELWQKHRDSTEVFARMLQAWKILYDEFQIPPFADESEVFRRAPRI